MVRGLTVNELSYDIRGSSPLHSSLDKKDIIRVLFPSLKGLVIFFPLRVTNQRFVRGQMISSGRPTRGQMIFSRAEYHQVGLRGGIILSAVLIIFWSLLRMIQLPIYLVSPTINFVSYEQVISRSGYFKEITCSA
jgi:hypothetical protein